MENRKKMKNEFIEKWVESALTKTKNVNRISASSYTLKHICEESIGVYVSNQEMIDTLKELGFEMKIIKGTPNYLFNISSIIKKVVFKTKLGNEYNNKTRHFNMKTETVEI